MTKFLAGSELSAEIRSILREPNSRSAVAFWGHGSESWLTGSGARVVANLRMGGTNPHAFKRVQGDKRQCDTLHAKVYIGSERAVACSANASANGLSLEGSEQSGWLEAGVLIKPTADLIEWFEGLWADEARSIVAADWARAEELWRLRARAKPPLLSFADFDPTMDNLPVVTWVNTGQTWTAHVSAVEDQIGVTGLDAERRVDEGLWIRNEADGSFLCGRWVLFWTKTAKGQLSKRGSPWFTRMSNKVVAGGFSWDSDGEPQDVLLSEENPTPAPFDATERRFVKAFSSTVSESRFRSLLDNDNPSEPWYQPRLDIMRNFWVEVHKRYSQDDA
ncbi:phospholipase D family protein [Sphingomonas sp. Leaf339]|uniref:phospholipase D family protein n=1 Tax=Sphingomonas sp. Leaf339 TaxID=1736343 RepID=UPI000A42D573|nr:phospholipase D family protein [Sphingomonas sp. Leaf339]